MERLALIGVNPDMLHLFFFPPFRPYSTDRRLLEFSGELPPEGPPPVTDISVSSFDVLHTV